MTEFAKMDPEVKAAWVTALRSGQYIQGKGALASERGGFCCLGVLYDACVDGDWVRDTPEMPHWGIPEGTWGTSFGSLPPSVRKAVGLDSSAQPVLIAKNDFRRQSFEEIADWIEENL